MWDRPYRVCECPYKVWDRPYRECECPYIVWYGPYGVCECPYIVWDHPYRVWECPCIASGCPYRECECPYRVWDHPYRVWECPCIVWECPYREWECPYRVWECQYIVWDCPIRPLLGIDSCPEFDWCIPWGLNKMCYCSSAAVQYEIPPFCSPSQFFLVKKDFYSQFLVCQTAEALCWTLDGWWICSPHFTLDCFTKG